jgi:ATP-dependent RNA helicase DeaD
MTNFEEMGFTPGILKAIQELGFEQPMPVQEKVIPLMLRPGQEKQRLSGCHWCR